MTIEKLFITKSIDLLQNEYIPKIDKSIMKLNDEQIWWRPNEHSNSIANLLLHLNGNVRQYLIAGVGEKIFERKRELEFNERKNISSNILLNQLKETVNEATEILNKLDLQKLTEVRIIQGKEKTLLEAIYHSVEHFSMHTGQIIFISKLLLNEDLEFYEIKNGIPHFKL